MAVTDLGEMLLECRPGGESGRVPETRESRTAPFSGGQGPENGGPGVAMQSYSAERPGAGHPGQPESGHAHSPLTPGSPREVQQLGTTQGQRSGTKETTGLVGVRTASPAAPATS